MTIQGQGDGNVALPHKIKEKEDNLCRTTG